MGFADEEIVAAGEHTQRHLDGQEHEDDLGRVGAATPRGPAETCDDESSEDESERVANERGHHDGEEDRGCGEGGSRQPAGSRERKRQSADDGGSQQAARGDQCACDGGVGPQPSVGGHPRSVAEDDHPLEAASDDQRGEPVA